MATPSDLTQHLINVVAPTEGRRFKVTLKGDITSLPVRKIKKYLVASSGLDIDEQLIKYNGVELGDEVLAGEVGIASGATLIIERRTRGAAPFVASPQKQAIEMETIDLQRAMLEQEKSRRDDTFRRQQDALHQSLSLAEQRRQELEREKQEKETELARLQELERLAVAERTRLEEVRRAEAERESLRAKDLEARKDQLNHERLQQRQLEMMRLENERKKMLLQQQRAEYEGEKTRLERERKERIERIKKQELLVREREVDLERASIEAERQRRLLLQEKEMLEQQRTAELEMVGITGVPGSQTAGRATSTHITATPRGAAPTTPRGTSVNTSGAFTPNHPREAELAALRREKAQLLAQQQSGVPSRQAGSSQQEDEVAQAIAAERAEIDALKKSSRVTTPASMAALPIDTDSPPRDPSILGAATARSGDALRALATEQLKNLSDQLGIGALTLDDNQTCVVSVEERYTLLITFDATTQRLYLYSTLSTFIPKSPETKLRLYEFLLEGALLGRDMCGGGVGVSLRNDFVLLSTSVFLPKSSPTALCTVTPLFVENLAKWRSQVRDLLADDNASGMYSTTTVGAATPAMASSARAQPVTYIPDDQFDETVTMPSLTPVGGPEMPVVGIEVTEGDDGEGVIVIRVKGPAARAGILPNDVIRKVNAAPISNLRDFQVAVKALRPNTAVPFVIERARAQLLVNVLVGSTHARGIPDPKYGVVSRVAAAGVADGAAAALLGPAGAASTARANSSRSAPSISQRGMSR